MAINKKNIRNLFYIFLTIHLIIWTAIPTFTNNNLPLDTIEALAWGSNLDWGFNKHPPLSAFAVEVFYQIFGNQDWVYYCWKGLKQNDITSWLLFGLFAGLGILSKYLFVYLLIALDVFFIYLIIKRKFNFKCFVSLISFFIVLLPHLIWLIDNNYITVTYALHRTGIEDSNFFISHISFPSIFLGKQIGILIPFFVMFFFIISKLKTKINFKDKKLIFLVVINIAPIVLIFLTSLFMGVKIRTMWMTPFYLFMGVLLVYIFQKKIILKKFKYFISIFLILFISSPIIYFYISITQKNKRTDYAGKEISQIVQKKWDNNFVNKIGVVGGDEWHGGNLSYHLKDRPIWDNIFENTQISSLKNSEDGFIIIGDSATLLKICKGIFVEVKTQGVCMIGKKK